MGSLTYTGHTAAVHGVAWSPDGTHIASASADGSVQIWNATQAAPTYTYRRHSAGVNTVAWLGGDSRIASGSDDKTVRIWTVGEAGSDVKDLPN
ncbi:WD40 repeat domain-containing protein [Ktedonobacter racemifer]|uniref:WD40 repeat, subgroup n=1 Tax=Ktedonobacter racemifer DSM 44963 TaxID=485913 RepID=D6U5U4_KTERA|nr:hypothetical protein [Ktedonobacter racemifer]EFH80355.1 WD40 repeat, subgroup [Ktedonobacter racemifer DSM 44963]